MTGDLQQLMKNLKFKKMPELLAGELKKAKRKKCSYTQFLTRLLRAEYHDRRERSVQSRIKRAKIPELWALETFPFKRQKGVHAPTIRQLAELNFIAQAQNIVFIGDTGVGKTGLATGILLKALENGYRGYFIKAQDLFDEMYASLADQSTRKYLNRLARIELLVIDEMGYLNLRPEQTNIFFKLMEDRYGHTATIVTTNLDYDDWYEFLGNKSMVGALLDRLRHRCHTIRIKGSSLRKPEC